MIFLDRPDGIVYDGIFTVGTSLRVLGRIGTELVSAASPDSQRIDARGWVLLPGFVDPHIHGLDGIAPYDCADTAAAAAALDSLSMTLPAYGVTAYMATSMTGQVASTRVLVGAAEDVAQRQSVGCARLLGVNLEGPYLSEDAHGAHSLRDLEVPNEGSLERWSKILWSPAVRQMTVAPELFVGSSRLQSLMLESRTKVAFGHSAFAGDELRSTLSAHDVCATHLFNAMGPLHQRRTSLVPAVLSSRSAVAELIFDPHLVAVAWQRLAVASMSPHRVMAISDALPGSGSAGANEFELCGTEVVRAASGLVRQCDGAVWGSRHTVADSVRLLRSDMGLGWNDVAEVTSGTAARWLEASDRGGLALDRSADVVAIDTATLSVQMTICEGTVGFLRDPARSERP